MNRVELQSVLELKTPETQSDIEYVRNLGYSLSNSFFAPKSDVGFALLVFDGEVLVSFIMQCVP
jgi:hypothetical protein